MKTRSGKTTGVDKDTKKIDTFFGDIDDEDSDIDYEDIDYEDIDCEDIDCEDNGFENSCEDDVYYEYKLFRTSQQIFSHLIKNNEIGSMFLKHVGEYNGNGHCRALCKTGNQCKNKMKFGIFCNIHKDQSHDKYDDYLSILVPLIEKYINPNTDYYIGRIEKRKIKKVKNHYKIVQKYM